MPEFLLALFLVVLLLMGVAIVIRLFVNVDSPFWSAWRRASIAAVVRRESSDLDRRYEELLRS